MADQRPQPKRQMSFTTILSERSRTAGWVAQCSLDALNLHNSGSHTFPSLSLQDVVGKVFSSAPLGLLDERLEIVSGFALVDKEPSRPPRAGCLDVRKLPVLAGPAKKHIGVLDRVPL